MLKKLKKQIIALIVLALLLLAVSFLKEDRYICEYTFARGFSRYYISVVGSVISLLPFSLYELLVVAVAFLLVFFLVKAIVLLFKKAGFRSLKIVLNIAVTALSLILLYNTTASFYYNREPLNIVVKEDKPDEEYVLAAAQFFMDDFNALAKRLQRDESGNVIPPYGKEISDKIKAEYAKLEDDYFNTPQTYKPMLFSEIMSYLSFSGVFMSITAEPNINVDIPPMEIPAVAAHEMAHSAGVMRENEANLISYYVLLKSDDDYLRYSAYSATFNQLLDAVFFTCGSEAYIELVQDYSPLIIKERQNAAAYWKEHKSFIKNITSKLNDFYLKLSGVKEGTNSYEIPYETVETGETYDNGDIKYEITYSALQKIFFTIYDNRG